MNKTYSSDCLNNPALKNGYAQMLYRTGIKLCEMAEKLERGSIPYNIRGVIKRTVNGMMLSFGKDLDAPRTCQRCTSKRRLMTPSGVIDCPECSGGPQPDEQCGCGNWKGHDEECRWR